MEKKHIFWLLVIALSVIADFGLPIFWGLLATIPIILLSWWLVYRSNWF